MPFYGTGRDELHLAFNFLFVHADLDAGADARDRRGRRGRPAARRLAGLHRLQPRRRPARHALGAATTSGARASALLIAAHAARHPVSVLRRRDRAAATSPQDAETALDPVARRTGDPSRQPRRLPDADARGRPSRAAGSRRPRRRRGCRSATSPRTTSPRRGRTPPRRCTSCATSSRCGARTPDLTAGAYATLDAPDGAWAYRRGDGFAVAVNLSDAAVTVDGLAGRIAIGDRPRARRRGGRRRGRAWARARASSSSAARRVGDVRRRRRVRAELGAQPVHERVLVRAPAAARSPGAGARRSRRPRRGCAAAGSAAR